MLKGQSAFSTDSYEVEVVKLMLRPTQMVNVNTLDVGQFTVIMLRHIQIMRPIQMVNINKLDSGQFTVIILRPMQMVNVNTLDGGQFTVIMLRHTQILRPTKMVNINTLDDGQFTVIVKDTDGMINGVKYTYNAKSRMLRNSYPILRERPKTIDAVFLGYAKNSSVNRFLVINSEVKEVANNIVMEARDATFFEYIFSYKTRISKEVQTNEKPASLTTIESLESQELRRSKRARVEKIFGDDFYTFLVEGDPTTYKEAVMSVDAPFWKDAINDEFQSIIQNNT
ncbi:hypothetical protein L3X38_031636 [Prunus dulcis]|uniref:Uncharacterized protein n=1 Tax=Prunus dulcis TaxID=3755 RepID=A0AAD4VDZ4_PRUDU|nr:hypothetical protein L3X38_031636 [Prunus dulcis]